MNCKKLFRFALIVLLVLLAGGGALAEGNVAKINGNEYATFDAALAAAADGDTITLLQDATTVGIALENRSLTIDGQNHKLTFTNEGIALWTYKPEFFSPVLTFNSCNIEMNGIGATARKDDWKWMAIEINAASLILNNTLMSLTAPSNAASNIHAIYCENFSTISMTNSSLSIRNYPHNALEWNGGSGGYYFTMDNSTFIAEKNRSGLAGTFGVKATNNSIFNVNNNTGNGSNGSHFDFENCTVEFNNNGAVGLSAGNLTLKDTTLTANNNKAEGVTFTGTGTIANSHITVSGTVGNTLSKWGTYPAAFYIRNNATCTIDDKSSLTIQDNTATGLLIGTKASLSAEKAQITITRNYAYMEHLSAGTVPTDELAHLAKTGGGIHVRSGASATLPSNAQVYNNHALVAGDDIYVEPSGAISFGNTGAGWKLDGDPDCTDAIDGWYDDSEPDADSGESRRWEAHATGTEKNYIKLETGREFASLNNPLALKAAHGLRVVPGTPSTPTVDVPQTGDSTPLMLYAMLAALSLAAFAVLLRRRAHG